MRALGIPCVLDRLIEHAVRQVLQGRIDPTFSPYSFGFRPGRSAHQAVAQAQQYVAEGCGWVVDIDLEKFFDRVNHDLLMDRVAKRVTDKRLRKLIRAFLNAGVMENGLVSPTEEGTPQGSPLSPLLSNLVLDELDRELTRRGLRFCRYGDDCNIYVRSRRAGERVMGSVGRFLTTRLRLTINRSKSAVARPGERRFLGFSISNDEEPIRQIAPQALRRFKTRVRELTRRTRGVSLNQMIASLTPYLVGWGNYYGFCQTPRVVHNLNAWIRRRLRMVVWRQWNNGEPATRNCDGAVYPMFGRRWLRVRRPVFGAWRGMPPSSKPCPTRIFARSTFPDWRCHRPHNLTEPPWYGPVCPVVWEEGSREAPSYPDQLGRLCGLRPAASGITPSLVIGD
jgi:RNA-directed DNA polymerase